MKRSQAIALFGALLIIIGLFTLFMAITDAKFLGTMLRELGLRDGYRIADQVVRVIEPFRVPLLFISAGMILYGIKSSKGE